MTLYTTLLALNTLWFGAGFCYFGLVPGRAARMLVPRAARGSPVFATLVASLRFLGGLNFAFSAFSLLLLSLLLLHGALFPLPAQQALFAAVFALAHASQFVSNLPVALRGGRQGDSLWPVFSGPMLFIFTVDGLLMLANGALAWHLSFV